MNGRKKTAKTKAGKPPGTLLYLGEKEFADSQILFVNYNEENFEQKNIKSIEQFTEAVKNVDENSVNWINISGLHNITLLAEIGKIFGIHNLIIEDILNVYQRPKIEIYDNYIFLSIKHITKKENTKLLIEQVSIIVAKNFVITFQDSSENIFKTIYERMETGKNIFRKSKQDYLFYVLFDFIVDHYFVMNEELNEEIDSLQEELFKNGRKNYIEEIHKLKKTISKIKQAVKPGRDILANFLRGDSEIINKTTLVYFKDIYDHLVQINEELDQTGESITSLLEAHLSLISNRLNEVIKVLTIISTIFIPGIYGMNFRYMPELDWKFGYPLILSVMFCIGVILVLFFKKKKWF